jgi:uncharacterized protein
MSVLGSPAMTRTTALRYATWIHRHAWLVVGLSVLLAVVATTLALRLTVKSDLSSLLPPSQQSVRDLKALQKRARAFGTVFVVVDAPTVAELEIARDATANELKALPKELVSNVTADAAVARQFFWQHRFIYVSIDDLTAARDALGEKLRQGKLKANPLYISLDDDDADSAANADNQTKLDKLKQRLHDAERDSTDPGRLVSKDGKTALFILQTTFPTSDASKGKPLLALLNRVGERIESKLGNNIKITLTGTVTVSMYEHDSVLDGMAMAGLITIALCGIALLLFYRSGLAVISVLWSLALGVLSAFALTWVFIGHLNVMSAFLTAIVVGNGINAGLMLLARYFEERRASDDPNSIEVTARAISGATRGTLAATVTALLAYGSLTLTDFRGFRHFGIIAGMGMVACWISAFTVLPATLVLLGKRNWLRVGKAPRLGLVLARLVPLPARIVAILGIVATLGCGFATWRFASGNPFLKDWRDLQSSNKPINATRTIDVRLRETFDRKIFMGLSNQLVVGLSSADQVAPLVASLRSLENARPPGLELLVEIRSVADLVPLQQAQKILLLDEVRTLLDDDGIATLDDDERKTLESLRPPIGLVPLQFADVPTELSWPFVEQDGSIGKLILLKGSSRFNTWMVDERVDFANQIRKLPMPAGAILGGEGLVVADIVRVMERDAPLLILVALLGAIATIGVAVGFRRHGLVTLLCGLLGVTAMITVCAAVGIRVHFLDLIALPITIGIGIEYAVNIASRDRQDAAAAHVGRHHVMEQTGGAVALCSFTTMVGYGSLLLSANGGIRSFGLAAMIGEVTCVVAALVFAPAMLTWLRRPTTNESR